MVAGCGGLPSRVGLHVHHTIRHKSIALCMPIFAVDMNFRRCVIHSSKTLLLVAIVASSCDLFGQYNVNTLLDTPDANPGDGVCADAGGFCSLRAAIMESNAVPGNNTVFLPAGEYVFTIAGANENASVTGDLDITGNLVITGEDTRTTIVRADSLDRVFDILPGVNATIEYLEMWEGSVYASNGGAIRNQGTLALSEVGIQTSMCEGDGGGQQGGGFGGAIYNSGTLDMSEVTIHSCLARGGKGANGVSPGGGSGGGAGPGLGGAIYNDVSASCTVINSTISNNIARGGRGGNGTFHQGSGTVSSPGGNGGGFGGNGGPVNSAGSPGSWGGGGGGGASLSGAGGAGGFGGGGGGGGANSWGGNSGPGGAAGQYGGAGGQGCCSAGSGGGGGAGLGGGMFNRSPDVEITNCTFAFNQAIGGDGGSGWFSGPGAVGSGKGGAVFNLDGVAFLNNSLFAENSTSTDASSLFGTFDSNAGHNLVQTTDAGVALNGNTAGNLLNSDPFILPLANNGGNTDTHLLESCDPVSPAIDAGNDAFAPALDQVGQARVNISEIGSLEVLASSVNLLPPDTTLCIGETLLLDVTSDNSTYTWNDASTDPTLLVNAEGTYSVTVHQNGCDFFDEITVDYNPLESIDLGPDQSLCPGTTVLLDASFPGATYEWQDGAIAPTYNVTVDGTYSVTVTLGDCSANDSVVIHPVDAVDLDLGADVALCQGESAVLSTDIAADSYTWSTAENTSSITVSSSGDYTLEISVDGCTYSATVNVEVSPNPTFNLGNDMDLCDGETTVLDVSSQAGTFEWQDGSTDATYTVNQAGTYSVIVIQGDCIGSDEIEIVYHPVPIFTLGEDVTVCYSSGFQLEVTTLVAGASISWNTGQSSAVITPQSTGTYQAIASANGCVFSDAIDVTVIPPLSLDLGEDQIVCKGTHLALHADVFNFQYPLSYSWSEDGNDSTLIVTETGNYQVTAESECEVLSDDINVLFEQCGCFLYVPNAFTPDDDGVNDYFAVETECNFDLYELKIFNRYGELIFESADPSNVWVGSDKNGGYYVPDGVYVWRIEYVTNTLGGIVTETMMGHVLVMR